MSQEELNQMEPYDQLLRVMKVLVNNKNEAGGVKDENPILVFETVLQAIDRYTLGKIERNPIKRTQWLLALRNLKLNLKNLLESYSKES